MIKFNQWLENQMPSVLYHHSMKCQHHQKEIEKVFAVSTLDPLPQYEKGVSHTFSGSRVKRGLYRSADGRIINADVYGSANIGRKGALPQRQSESIR
jgi:hypothetical protein